MKISTANFNDISLLSDLDSNVNLTPWSTNDYIGSYNNSNNKIFLLKINNQIISCVVVSLVIPDAEIIQLWVRSNFQKQGIATKMLTQLFTLLKNKYFVNQIFLEVMVSNTSAIALYKKLKFERVGLRKNYYKIEDRCFDAFTMSKYI